MLWWNGGTAVVIDTELFDVEQPDDAGGDEDPADDEADDVDEAELDDEEDAEDKLR